MVSDVRCMPPRYPSPSASPTVAAPNPGLPLEMNPEVHRMFQRCRSSPHNVGAPFDLARAVLPAPGPPFASTHPDRLAWSRPNWAVSQAKGGQSLCGTSCRSWVDPQPVEPAAESSSSRGASEPATMLPLGPSRPG